jgi:hypothetical protein
LGDIQKRYNFFTDGADQYCGRTVAALPFHSGQFATLPPHFSREILDSITKEEWMDILPLYNSYPPGFARTLPFLLASIVYHHDWLRATLSADHMLFNCPLFTHARLFERLRGEVLLGELQCPVTKINATGIPPHLAVTSGVNRMEASMRESNEILLTEIPIRVKETVFNNLVINGAVPITPMDLNTHFNKMLETVKSTLYAQQRQQQIIEEKSQPRSDNELFTWGGKFHPIPQNFKMPQVDCKTLWRLWHYGRDSDKIGPFSGFHKFDFSITKEASKYFKGQKVMNVLRDIAVELKEWPTDKPPRECPKSQMDSVFDKAFAELIKRVYEKDKSYRAGELAYSTMSNRIITWEKQRARSVMGAAVTIASMAQGGESLEIQD